MSPTHRLLQDLVRLPSVNPMGRAVTGDVFYEHRVTAYLEQFFIELGVPYKRTPVAPLRDNIVARYESPGAKVCLLFEVHQDTVPVDGMTIDPFAGEVRDGRLFGRGACDVKGGMTAMLAAFARLVREKPTGAANAYSHVPWTGAPSRGAELMRGVRAGFAVVPSRRSYKSWTRTRVVAGSCGPRAGVSLVPPDQG